VHLLIFLNNNIYFNQINLEIKMQIYIIELLALVKVSANNSKKVEFNNNLY